MRGMLDTAIYAATAPIRLLGRALNIPTPASDTVFTVLKLHRMGSQS
jgi:hypothetical protein